MKQEHIDVIKNYYDSQGEYKINRRYSGEQGTVYTKPGDNAHWLIIEGKEENAAEVRQTDHAGRITARDTYKAIENTVICTQVQRRALKNGKMVEFEPDEIRLIRHYGQKDRKGTVDVLKAVGLEANDGYSKRIVQSTIYKLSALSEESCSELISSIRNSRPEEHRDSIKRRLADAKKRQQELAVLKGNKARHKENIVL